MLVVLTILPYLVAMKCQPPMLILEREGNLEVLDGDATAEEVGVEDGRWPASAVMQLDPTGNPETIWFEVGSVSIREFIEP